jgi:DNA-binding NarL/FixJ family response regulator
VTRRLIGELASQTGGTGPALELDVLTDWEREGIELVTEGLTNDEIERRLYVRPMTDKTHTSRAMVKLPRDRALLVVFA